MKDWIKSLVEKMNIVKVIFAWTSLFLLCFMCYALVYVAIPEGNKEALYILIGIIATSVSMIGNFEFGSSRGSQKKDEIIKEKIEEAK